MPSRPWARRLCLLGLSLGSLVLACPQGERSQGLKGQTAGLSGVEDARTSDQRLRCVRVSVPGLFCGCFTPERAECLSVFLRAIACPLETRGAPAGGSVMGTDSSDLPIGLLCPGLQNQRTAPRFPSPPPPTPHVRSCEWLTVREQRPLVLLLTLSLYLGM